MVKGVGFGGGMGDSPQHVPSIGDRATFRKSLRNRSRALRLRRERIQGSTHPVLGAKLGCSPFVQFLKKFSHPRQSLLNEVDNSVDEAPDSPCSGQQWATLWILARSFRPIVLRLVKIGTMIIHRSQNCRFRIVCFSERMMVVHNGMSLS